MTQVIDTYELSPMQAGMLFHAVSAGRSGVDVEQVIATLHEPLDEALFLRAWQRVAERHPILRTRFRWEGIAEPIQDVVDRVEIPVEKFDWRALAVGERRQKLQALLDHDRDRGFDLGEVPLMRLTVVRNSESEYRVLWTFHHALLDGRSFPVVLREVFACYESCVHGKDAALPPARPYRDYIDWLRTFDHNAAKTYWQRMLAGFRAPTPLVVARERESEQGTGPDRGAHEIRLPVALTAALRVRAREASVTLNTLLQAAWALLLHHYSGESDIILGATRACRRSALGGADDMIGLFINTLPIRVNLDPEFELEPWLRRLREQQLMLREFEHTPLVKVQGWSEVPRGRPLFESILVYENQSLDAQLRATGDTWRDRGFQYLGQTNYPLTLIAYGDQKLRLQIEYSRRRFGDDVVARMLGHLRTLLKGMVENPAARLKDLSLLTKGERHQAVSKWNTSVSYPRGACLHERFEQQVARTPDAVALVYEDQRLSYAELNRRANQLAHRLRELGVVPDQLVGLRIERSVEMAIGILGILKSGGAYLPLDPAYPRDRIAFMLEDSRVEVVVTQESLTADLEDIAVTQVLLDKPLPRTDANPAPLANADNLAYVIYTSGSTGKPKGALISHYNVTRLFEATEAWYHFDAHDVWTLFHSYAFDFSVWELWGALLYGGRVVVVPYWVSRSPEDFRKLLINERVTVLNQTPSAFRQLIKAELSQPKADLALRYVIFGGEALELQSLRPWFERYGDGCPLLVNMYGITETTVHVTYRPIRQADLDSNQGSVIGVAIADLQVYILDPQGQPTPIGVPGEMYVGGAGVARGYLNRAELTAQRFVQNLFNPAQSARLYRTGDLARRLENGDIEYLGRIDHQVKIRGYRIELGEIETGIARHPAVREVVVLAREDAPGDKRLVAYVVAENPPTDLLDQLRALILTTMPEYMVPAHFVTLDALPLTENGKVDRKALATQTISRDDSARRFAAPRTPTEETLALIWSAVLGIDKVGIHDHFFELGGDSILSIQVISRCRQAKLHLTPKDLFDRPTVAQLAEKCAPVLAEADGPQELLTGTVPITPIEGWFLEQDIAERSHWNQAFLFELPADADLAVLNQALHQVVRHHDALRLRLQVDGTNWLQEYGNDADPTITRVDLSGDSIAQRAAAIQQHATRAQASLDLADGPLLREMHFSLGPRERGRLLLVIHHIAVDGVSWRVIREDLERAYFSLLAGEQPVLPAKTTSYQTWANRLAGFAQSSALLPSLSYWLAEAGKPVTALAAGQSDCANLEGEACSVKRHLKIEETRALLQLVPASYHTQINDVLLTALARALQHWTGGAAFRIDLEGHGREDLFGDVDVSRTVGWFTNMFPVRLELDANFAEGKALKSIKEQLRRVPDRGMSYGLLRYGRDDSNIRSALAQAPRSDLLFNYLGQFDQVVTGSNLFSFATESTGPWHDPRSRRTHALEVLCLVRAGKLEFEWIYHPNIHPSDAIDRLADDFLAALRATIVHCLSPGVGGRTPSDFPLAALEQAGVDALWKRFPAFEDVYPLSPMQRLFHAMDGTTGDPGFEQWHFRLDGVVDPTLLRRSIEQVVARHTILRTAFVSDVDAEPLQVVLREVSLPWSEEDWRGLDCTEQDARLAVLMQSDRRTGFDLAQAPLMRVALRRIAKEAYHLVWSTHHLYIDGWSWPLVFRDVSHIYEALRQGSEPQMSESLPYRNYVAWLRTAAPDSERFWKDELAGIAGPTPLNLADSPTGSRDAIPGCAEEYADIDHPTTAALQALARFQHVTLSTIVQGAWSLLISHYSGSHDVVFGAAFSGRPTEVAGIESLVGPCVNNLPVRVTTSSKKSLLQWLLQLQQRQLGLSQHQYVPLELIQKWAQVPWRHRLFDSLIVFQNYQVDESACCLGSDARLVPIATPETTNYPLTIAVRPNRVLSFRLIYHRDRFAPDVVRTYVADLTTILQTIARRPQLTIAEIMALLPAHSRGKAAALATMKAPEPRALYSAPTTETERAVASLWQELFGIERVSLDDNFFDLGGHSLLLLQAHSRLRATVRPDLPVVAMLQYPTIRTLGRYLSGHAAPSLSASGAADRARMQREALSRQRSIMEKR
jgi:amino acid adenylation domain-containing protein/non-ribosomal peptide synthase protein (TIGR01720 family)